MQVKKMFIFYASWKPTQTGIRGESTATATSKMERFVIIVNDWKPLTIITNRSILVVAVVLDPPLKSLWGVLGNFRKVFIDINNFCF